MVINENMLGFLTTCLIIELTPGPNMSYLIITSLAAGRRAGLAAVAGVTIGLSVISISAALGAAELMLALPMVYHALRGIGAAYLLWIAWGTWHNDMHEKLNGSGVAKYSQYFRQGLVLNLLNLKSAAFYMSVLPGFIDKNSTTIIGDSLMLTAISVTMATAMHCLIVISASSLKPILETPKRQKILRRTLALLLVAVAVWFVL